MLKVESKPTVDAHEQEKNFVSFSEFQNLLNAAHQCQRNKVRNKLMIMMLYRHGLRESELCNIQLSDINLKEARIWIRRLKGGLSTEHPIAGDELRLIKQYLRTKSSDAANLPWLFTSEQNQQISRHTVIYILKTVGQSAGFGKITPHMLRHGCGYYLANKGYDSRLIQDYLGHRDPKHTAKYTRTASNRFQGLW